MKNICHDLTGKAAVRSQAVSSPLSVSSQGASVGGTQLALHLVFAAQVAGDAGAARSPPGLHGPAQFQSLLW